MNELFLFSYGLLWLLVLFLLVASLATLRHMAYFVRTADPLFRFRDDATLLRVGQQVPRLDLRDLATEAASVPHIDGDGAFVLIVDVNCKPCHDLLERTASVLRSSVALGWQSTVVVRGTAASAAQLAKTHALDDSSMVIDEGQQTARAWGITSTPTALLVDARGNLSRVLASSDPQTIAQVLSRSPSTPARAVPLAQLGR